MLKAVAFNLLLYTRRDTLISHLYPRGGGVLPYITYTGMFAQRGRDFEAPDLERDIHFRGVF